MCAVGDLVLITWPREAFVPELDYIIRVAILLLARKGFRTLSSRSFVPK